MTAPKVAIKSIMEIVPYLPGESKVKNQGKVIKLSSNENPFGPSPKAIAAMKAAAEKAHLYPDGGSHELRRAIGKVHDIDPAQIVCGAGSDELIALISQAYAGQGDEILYNEFGFLMYPISARRAGAKPVIAPEKNYCVDIDSVLAKVTGKTKIVFLASPNNPTGSYITKREFARLRNGLPDNVLLVIDAAYAEYVTKDDYEPGTSLVEAGNNTVMLRTFSKLYGLASLRLGWAYAPEGIIDVLNRVRGPFNVSGMSQAAGVAAMEDQEYVKKVRDHNSKWLDKLTVELSKIGLKVFPSAANFVLVEFPENSGKTAQDADNFLKDNAIIGRRMEAYGLPRCLRFSIGLEQENGALIKALSEFLGK